MIALGNLVSGISTVACSSVEGFLEEAVKVEGRVVNNVGERHGYEG